MRIVELTIQEFDDFASNNNLSNYCQSSKYAKLMGEKGFSYDYIGYRDDSNNLVAASLILTKKIGSFNKFAYAPKGFLIDYYNQSILKMFVKDLSTYYKRRGFIFIKINPEIIIGVLNPNRSYSPDYNQNVSIIDTLKDLGFKRRREIRPLDFIMPRISPYITLKKFNINNLDQKYQDLIKNSNNRGLMLEVATNKDIQILYNIIKDTTYEDINYYRNMLNIFNNGDSELLLLKVDYTVCLANAQKQYEKEIENNNYWNTMIQNESSEKNLFEKMESDKRLYKYKEEMVSATDRLRREKYQYVGGAIVIKYQNRVSVVACGFNKYDSYLAPGYFLYSALIERYKNDYEFLDLFGLSSNFNPDSEYYSFNEEKLAFKPTLYEFIGEFDLILNESKFKSVQSKGLLSKEFYSSYKFNIEE